MQGRVEGSIILPQIGIASFSFRGCIPHYNYSKGYKGILYCLFLPVDYRSSNNPDIIYIYVEKEVLWS